MEVPEQKGLCCAFRCSAELSPPAVPKTTLEKEIKEVTSVTSPVTSLESRAGVLELLVNSVSREHRDTDQQAPGPQG